MKSLALAALLIPAFACSGGGSGSGTNTITSAVQDVTADPEGMTTVLTFASSSGLSGAGITNFQTDGTQNAVHVSVSGNTVTVDWDARVTQANRVLVTGLAGVWTGYSSVTPSTTSAPTFTLASGTQTAGLGGDTFDVVFSGPHVVESDVEDVDNWTLTVNSTDLDLTGSTIVFDTNTQTAAVTLGTLANLHAAFSFTADAVHAVTDVPVGTTAVSGTASGDTTAPTLVSATQNLAQDEFGRVIDFQFSEAMDPVFSVQLGHFGVTSPDIATAVSRPSSDTLRVTFNNPIVPGVDTVALSSLVDAHGNDFVDASVPITQGSAVVNAYDTVEASTVANAGGDFVTVLTTQALDPDSATAASAWTLVVDSVTVDLSTQTLDYDLESKTLTISLDFDMLNGDSFSVTGVSAVDVDGDAFTLSTAGTVAGETTAPTVGTITQNRNTDVTGKTVIVQFSEDVDATTAETTGNYTISGTQNLASATLLSGGKSVRLEYDAFVLPGTDTISVQNVADLAGNSMSPAAALPIATTDSTAPNINSVAGNAVEGAANDLLFVTFDDDMVPDDLYLTTNWSIESPVGTPVPSGFHNVVYTASTRTATIELSTSVDLQRGDDVQVSFTNCRDIGGNTITATPVSGGITTETTLPELSRIWRDGTNLDQVVVVFSEPVQNATSLYDATTNPGGAHYVLRTSGGSVRGVPTSALASPNGLSVRLLFGFVVGATDTLDVTGVVDTCGNPMFPALSQGTVAEDTATPAPLSVAYTSVSGENNDTITIVFDRPMNPYTLTDPSHYEVLDGLTEVDLANTRVDFDGVDTVTFHLKNFTGQDLVTGDTYDFQVDGVYSAQGVELTSPASYPSTAATGDNTAPTVGVSDVRLDPSTANSLLITADEALWTISSQDPAFYDYNGGNLATAASRAGPRTVRVTFAVQPIVGGSLAFTLFDLAQNSTGSITRNVAAADGAAPLVTSVTGTSVSGLGGDTVTVTFDEQVDTATALDPANYQVTNGLRTLNPQYSRLTYQSATNTVTMTFASGHELDSSVGVTVQVQNIADHGGNVMASPVTLGGSVTGDTTAPGIASAFVNWRVDPTGKTIDVLFDEDVDETFSGVLGNWSASGGPSVVSLDFLEDDHVRVVLSSALGSSATVTAGYVEDPAANFATSISIDPVE